jgi:hypothetical protein
MSRLPYSKVKIKLKDFDNDPKYKEFKNIHGICNMGKNQDEIWLNKNKLKRPSDTIEFTKYHELVHVRRQEAGEDGPGLYEEDVVELEAVARTQKKTLSMSQRVLKDFLTHTFRYNKRRKKKVRMRLYPNKPEDLKEIHKKIKHILKHKYGK